MLGCSNNHRWTLTAFSHHISSNKGLLHISLLLLALVSCYSHAEKNLQLETNSFRILLNESLDFYVDDENLSYQQIIQPAYSKKFSPVIGNSMHQGFAQGVMWLRFRVSNNSDSDIYTFLEMSPNTLDYQVYSNDIKIKSQPERISGELPKLTSFSLDKGKTAVFYLKVKSSSTLNPDIFLSSSNKLLTASLESLKVNYYLLSAFFTLGLTCFFLSFGFKNPTPAIYGLYILAWIPLFLYSYHYLQPPEFLPNYTSILSLTLFINSLIFLMFARKLFDRLFNTNFWKNGFSILLAINTIGILLPFYSASSLTFTVCMVVIVATQIIIIFSSTIYYFRFQSPSALMLGVSKLANLLILSTIYSINFGRSDRFFVNDTTAYVGCLVEALIMVFTLVVYCGNRQKRLHEQDLAISVAEAKSSSQQNLLGKLTHELRTPLTGILGMTELLKDSILSPNQSEQVKTIHDSGEALLEMIEKVTTEVQVETGELTIHPEKLDLPALLADAIAHQQNRASEKDIEIILDITDSTPTYVSSDVLRLQQVILRVLDFILQLPLQNELVLKTTEVQTGITRFQLQFYSSGLQASSLQSLLYFDNKAGYNSLDIANHLIQLMGGKMDLFSSQNHKHTLSFTLPLQELEEATPPSTDFLLSNLQHKRILVVDDNKTCLNIIEQQSKSWGILITSCQSGQQALAQLRSNEDLGEPFDMVITDYLMPGMNGLELARKIQADQHICNKPPILMLTGVSNIPKNSISPQTGIQRIINKPLTGNRLRAILAEEFALNHGKNESTNRQETPASLKGVTVLIAEDNKVNAQVISTMLKKLGAETAIAQNGQHAVEKELCEKYDVILMDCEMPLMDGFEATRNIRKNQQKRHKKATPIIALTAHTEEQNLEKCLQAGMDAHMSKPVSINELQDLILRTLNKPTE